MCCRVGQPWAPTEGQGRMAPAARDGCRAEAGTAARAAQGCPAEQLLQPSGLLASPGHVPPARDSSQPAYELPWMVEWSCGCKEGLLPGHVLLLCRGFCVGRGCSQLQLMPSSFLRGICTFRGGVSRLSVLS